MSNQLIVSANCVCYINNVPLARCSGLTYSVNSMHKETHCVDILEPAEMIPIALSCTGTIEIYRLHGDGGIEAAGLIATWDSLTKSKYFSLGVKDMFADIFILQVDKCVVDSQAWRILPKGHVTGSVFFKGLRYHNESR